jgi:excisionase family DNA binding protein
MGDEKIDGGDPLLTPAEVADIFRVDRKTVTRWAAAGRVESIRTPGGEYRIRRSVIEKQLRGEHDEQQHEE